MRVLFPVLLLLSYPSWSQENPTKLISAVEQNLTANAVITSSTLSETITDQMRDWKVNGLSVAVIDKGDIAWAKAYGLKSSKDNIDQLDTATLFQCASIGKIVTALAALYLVDKGFITLDEDVNNKLVSWKVPESDFVRQKKVSLRNLLSHSSGLTDGYGFMGYAPGDKIPDLLCVLQAVPPANNKKKLVIGSVPGADERYSGGGYVVIQQLIEDVTGCHFDKFVDSIVFSPLGMMHSTYNYYPDRSITSNIAMAHQDNGRPYKRFNYKIYPEKAAAGFWTTSTDLARLIVGIQKIKEGKSSFFSRELLRELLTPQINSMGLGVHLKGDSAVTGFWHAGNNEGYTGILMATTETGQGAVILTNSNRGEWLAMEILRSVARTYDWPIILSLLPLPVHNTAAYCGVYVTADRKSLEINIDKEQLYFTRSGNKRKFRMYQTKKDNFRIAEKPDNLLFVFKRNEQEKIIGLSMYENAGQSYFFLHKK